MLIISDMHNLNQILKSFICLKNANYEVACHMTLNNPRFPLMIYLCHKIVLSAGYEDKLVDSREMWISSYISNI